MPHQPDDQRSLAGRPFRLAAVGAASLVCLLSVSGALGFSLTDGKAGAAQNPASAKVLEGAASLGGSNPMAAPPAQGLPAARDHGASAPNTGTEQAPPAEKVPLPRHSGAGKRVVFDMTAQRVWLVGPDGSVDRTYLVSGSKYDNLNAGTYSVSSRSLYATAYNSDETLKFMVRFAYGHTAPIGFHAIPLRPDGSLVEPRSGLGKPASDGCIRQWITDARALWSFATVGTTVVVLA